MEKTLRSKEIVAFGGGPELKSNALGGGTELKSNAFGGETALSAVSPGRSRAKPRLRLTPSCGSARGCLPRYAQQALSHPRNAPIR